MLKTIQVSSRRVRTKRFARADEGGKCEGRARWRVTVINSPPSGGSKETTKREVTMGVGEFVSERQMKLY